MNDSIETSEREAVTLNKYAAHAAQPTGAMPPAVLEFWIEQARALLNEAGAQVAALQADADLLSWLEQNPEHKSTPYYEDGDWLIPVESSGAGGFGGGIGYYKFDSLRKAIAAAASTKEPT